MMTKIRDNMNAQSACLLGSALRACITVPIPSRKRICQKTSDDAAQRIIVREAALSFGQGRF